MHDHRTDLLDRARQAVERGDHAEAHALAAIALADAGDELAGWVGNLDLKLESIDQQLSEMTHAVVEWGERIEVAIRILDQKRPWQEPDPDPDEGPGLTWRQLTPRDWCGSWNGKLHGTITAEADRWLAHVRLEDPPGIFSPTTTVGRFDTVEEAQVATDEVWAAR
jgi:hypothetical protein